MREILETKARDVASGERRSANPALLLLVLLREEEGEKGLDLQGRVRHEAAAAAMVFVLLLPTFSLMSHLYLILLKSRVAAAVSIDKSQPSDLVIRARALDRASTAVADPIHDQLRSSTFVLENLIKLPTFFSNIYK